MTRSGNATTITDSAGVTNASGPVCTQDTPNQVTCTGALSTLSVFAGDLDDRVELVFPAGTVQGVGVNGGDGNDVIDGSGVAAGTRLNEFAGYAGNDTVTGSPGKDILDQPGGLSTQSGGPLPDLTATSAGDDRLVAGDGDDLVGAIVGADVVEAGEGNDDIQTINVSAAGKPEDDGASDTISCGGGTDQAGVGPGDSVAADCETVYQYLSCPSGVECEGEATITAPGGASGSAALAAGSGGGKKRVLGKSRKVKLKSGQTKAVMIKLRSGKVNSALRKRSQVPATLEGNLEKKKNGKTVGHVKKKVRFKLKR